jgi:DNA-binding protein H-NS
MNLADLKAAAPMVSAKIAEREDAEKDAVKAELAELARSKGFEMGDLFGNAPKPTKERKPVAPKYRNPADGSQTWTGRGRKPKWIAEALDSGGTLDDFLIRD